MLSLQEKIEESVLALNTPLPEPLNHYSYGKDHWQNLADHEKDGALPFEERNKYFKLLWVDEDFQFNEFSSVIGCKFDGELLILASSKLSDPTYKYKYETHIKKLKEYAQAFQKKLLDCDNWNILNWKVIEVENIYDNNLDGIKIRFLMQHSI